MPSTSRGPGRENEAAASTASTRSGAERLDLVAVVERLGERLVGVEPARHHHDDLGARGGDLPQLATRDLRPGSPSGPCRPPPRSSRAPSGRRRRAGRATPAQRRAGAGHAAPPSRTASIRAASSSRSRTPRSRAPAASARRTASSSTSVRVSGSSEITSGWLGEPAGDRADVVVGDRAHRAQCLGDDQVDVEAGERLLVELVQGAALGGHLTHRGVDLARREPLRITLRVSRGRVVASGGWSHSCVTATTSSPSPSSNSISVAEGTRLAIRIRTDYAI